MSTQAKTLPPSKPMEKTATEPRPILWTADRFAQECDVAKRTVMAWHASGRSPKSATVPGRLLRWRAHDIIRWVELDCPDRKTFEKLIQSEESRNGFQTRCTGSAALWTTRKGGEP